MLKKTIKYTDIDGITREEDFYFNFTKAELLELQVSRAGGFAESMEHLRTSKNNKETLAVIKEIILKAYGERSNESRHFIKKPEHAAAFSHTEAFSNLFMELFEDAGKAAAFFENLMPADVVEQVRSEQRSDGRPSVSDYQKKAAPSKVGNDVVVEDGVVINTPQENDKAMSMEKFLELTPSGQSLFIERGGLIQQ